MSKYHFKKVFFFSVLLPFSLYSQNLTNTWTGFGYEWSSSICDYVTITTSVPEIDKSALNFGSGSTTMGCDIEGTYSSDAVFGNSALRNLIEFNPEGKGSIVFSFSRTVKNPIIHIDRIGGNKRETDIFGQTTILSHSILFSLLTPNLSFTRLSGNGDHFEVTPNTIRRTPDQNLVATGVECDALDAGTASGSVRVNGLVKDITLGFELERGADDNYLADEIEIIWELSSCNFDVSVLKEVDNPEPIVGKTVTFSITVANEGDFAAQNIILQDVLPIGYKYVSAFTALGTYSNVSGEWTIPELKIDEESVLQLTVEVLGIGEYLNTARILSLEGGEDTNPLNDVSSAEVFPICKKRYNEFTPNGDGVNDTFIISCIERYPDNRLEIYNRWGNLVYETRGYLNDWDGTSQRMGTIRKEEKLPVGTYYYILNLGDGSKSIVGWIYLNR